MPRFWFDARIGVLRCVLENDRMEDVFFSVAMKRKVCFLPYVGKIKEVAEEGRTWYNKTNVLVVCLEFPDQRMEIWKRIIFECR